jgi:phenylalanyl-tRNA synthetase alpha chain
MIELSPNEQKVLLALKTRRLSPEQLLLETKLEKLVEVMSALSWLKIKKLVTIDEKVETFYSLASEGKEYLKEGLPEKRILVSFKAGKFSIKVLLELLGKEKAKVALGYLKELGAEIVAGKLKIEPEKIKLIEEKLKEREEFLRALDQQEILEEKLNLSILAHFKVRKNILKKKTRVLREAELTELGRNFIAKLSEKEIKIAQLTPELIQSSKWKLTGFRKYDIHTFAPKINYGKSHPLAKLANKVRKIFLEMGFKEISYDYIQSCFWNMDALFIPQDHPARDAQASFYIPGKVKLEPKLAEKVKALQEKVWKYKWQLEEAEKLILRTHTTVNTIRYLAEHFEEQKIKVFSIGRNFRREAIDSTHLPEFTQIEGIVMEKGTSFSMLLGILKEFYSRLGFENITFRPSYLPFTEPSLEVIIEFKGKLLEMGGAGIFRPEVTKPFGIKYPVLAWGLGLERLAMLNLDLNDIRKLYFSDFEWLKESFIL